MAPHLQVVEPRHENRSVPVRPANAALRQREYLTTREVDRLIRAARDGRYGHRDATLILTAYRGTAFELARYATWNGAKWNSADRHRCMSGAPRTASRAFTQKRKSQKVNR